MSVLTAKQVNCFHEDGFLIVENLIDEEVVNRLVNRLEPLFSGEFDGSVLHLVTDTHYTAKPNS